MGGVNGMPVKHSTRYLLLFIQIKHLPVVLVTNGLWTEKTPVFTTEGGVSAATAATPRDLHQLGIHRIPSPKRERHWSDFPHAMHLKPDNYTYWKV